MRKHHGSIRGGRRLGGSNSIEAVKGYYKDTPEKILARKKKADQKKKELPVPGNLDDVDAAVTAAGLDVIPEEPSTPTTGVAGFEEKIHYAPAPVKTPHEEKCSDKPKPRGKMNDDPLGLKKIYTKKPVKKIDHGLRKGEGIEVYDSYNNTFNALRDRLGTDPADLGLEMAGAKNPYTKEGYINLKYDWSTAEAEKLRKMGPKITGLELRGYESTQNGVAWSVPVSDGFYNLVPPSFPVDLDEIDIDGAKTFDFMDPKKINRNRFDEWGPYYIRQSLAKNGDLITNVIARKMVMDERGPPTKWGSARYHLRWCYFTFGKTGHWNESRRDTIDLNLVGYDVLDNHEPNTTLLLLAGKAVDGKDGKKEKLPDKALARKNGETVDANSVKYSREACCNLKEVLLEVTPLDTNSVNLVNSFLVEGETEGPLDGERIVCNWGGSRDPRILRDDFFEDDFNNGRRRLMDAKRIRQHSMLRELYQ